MCVMEENSKPIAMFDFTYHACKLDCCEIKNGWGFCFNSETNQQTREKNEEIAITKCKIT